VTFLEVRARARCLYEYKRVLLKYSSQEDACKAYALLSQDSGMIVPTTRTPMSTSVKGSKR
jgi:hypothetical protein